MQQLWTSYCCLQLICNTSHWLNVFITKWWIPVKSGLIKWSINKSTHGTASLRVKKSWVLACFRAWTQPPIKPTTDWRQVDQRTWDYPCSWRAYLVYRWVQDGEGTGTGVYGQSVGRRRSISLGRYATVFQTEIYATLPVLMKFSCMVDLRSTWVFAMTDRWLWKLFRPSEQHLHWFNSAKRHWMISLPSTLWGCIGSLDMLGYEETKLPTSLHETVLFRSFFWT